MYDKFQGKRHEIHCQKIGKLNNLKGFGTE